MAQNGPKWLETPRKQLKRRFIFEEMREKTTRTFQAKQKALVRRQEVTHTHHKKRTLHVAVHVPDVLFGGVSTDVRVHTYTLGLWATSRCVCHVWVSASATCGNVGSAIASSV